MDSSSRNSISGGNGMKALNPFRRGTIMGGKKGLVKSSSEAFPNQIQKKEC